MHSRLWAAFALCMCSGAASAGYNSLVVLGDSLSDIGNGSVITGGVAPGTPTGRASNGPVAADYLAARLGITDHTASALGGTNYAVFGATTGTSNFSFVENVPAGTSSFPALEHTGMQTQFSQFAAAGPFSQSKTLFMIWGGANDILFADLLGEDLATAANAAVGGVMNLVGGLLGLGAQNILVVGMPDLGLTPFARLRDADTQAGLSALAAGFNDGLGALVAETGLLTGANLMFFDPAVVTQAIVAEPSRFGLSNIADQCVLSPEALQTNCEGYAFVDDLHPSTAVHAIFGEAMANLVPAPGSLWLLTIAGLAASRVRRPTPQHSTCAARARD